MKKEITIYTNETCTYCEQVKNKLKEIENERENNNLHE